MIEIAIKSLISLHEIPQRLLPRTSERPIQMSTVYRWIQRGVMGGRLEAIRIGGTTYTSLEALQRFGERLSESRGRLAAEALPTSSLRRRQMERAAQEAREILHKRRSQ